MHSKVIATIRNIVIAEVNRGVTVEVEAYCRILLPMCWGLTKREFEDIVLQAVADAGGTAVWGSYGQAREEGISTEPVVSVARAGFVVGGEPLQNELPTLEGDEVDEVAHVAHLGASTTKN